MTSHILSKCGPSLHCGWACAFSHLQQGQMPCCIEYKCTTFLCCVTMCLFRSLDWPNDFLQSEQMCIFSPFCEEAWFAILLWLEFGTLKTTAFDQQVNPHLWEYLHWIKLSWHWNYICTYTCSHFPKDLNYTCPLKSPIWTDAKSQ